MRFELIIRYAATSTSNYIALIQKNIVGWRIGTAPSSADLHFDATSTDFTGSPAMTISQTGKVGVGLITPVAPLHVFGTSADPSLSADTGVALIGGTNSAQLEIGSKPGSPYSMWMQVKASVNAGASFPLALNPLGGDVGIGIISPTGRLEVNGAGTTDFGATNPTLYLSRVAPYTANNLLRFQVTTATDAFIGTEGTSDDLMFGFVASGVERMRIKSTNGNVGIGTTSPATKLHMSSGTFTIDGNVSPAMTVKGSGAPPDGYALCLSGGSLGHCTTIVGVGGACTCSVP